MAATALSGLAISTAVPAAAAVTAVACPASNSNASTPPVGGLSNSPGPFACLAPGVTASLVGTGDGSTLGMAYGGVSFTPSGDPVVSGSSYLTKFDSTQTQTVHGSTVFPIAKSVGWSGCGGAANTADNKMMISDGNGPPNLVDPITLVASRQSQALYRGCWGIAIDPQTKGAWFAYNGPFVIETDSNYNATGYFYSPHGQPDGMAFDPTGTYLFASTGGGVSVFNRAGQLVNFFGLSSSIHSGSVWGQYIDGGTGGTDGIAFAAGAQKYVVTVNTDGTVSRFDFPNSDFTEAPSESVIAWGGSRGDNTEVGADGCLYLTQFNTQYADHTVGTAHSLVKLCTSGFVPPVGLGASFTVAEGSAFSGPVASFTDNDPNDTNLAATIDWGDGSTSGGTIAGSPSGGYTVSGTHTYADESNPKVTVTITGTSTALAPIVSNAKITDAALTAGTAQSVAANLGTAYSGPLASFTDANGNGSTSDFSATIDWGDGTGADTSATITSTGSGTYTVSGSHTYATSGSYTPRVTVTDAGGSSVVLTTAATVSAPLIVQAPSPTITYGDATGDLTPSYSGFVGGDDASSLTTAPTCAPTNPVNGVGTYTIRCAGGVSTKYAFTYLDGTLTVVAAPVTVTASSPAASYGSGVPVITAQVDGLVGADAAEVQASIVCSTVAPSHPKVGSYQTSCTEMPDSNYSFNNVDGMLQITPAPLTITPDNQARLYDTPNPALTWTATGLVNGDGPGAISGVELATTAVSPGGGNGAGSDVGTYDITATGGVDSDYTIAYGVGHLTVTTMPTTLAITSSPTRAQSSGQVTVTARLVEAAGGQNPITGRSITFTATPSSGAPVTGSGVSTAGDASTQLALATGTYSLSAGFAGDTNGDYGASSGGPQAIVVYAPTRFVIWGGNASPPAVGGDYNFWGSQWAKQVTAGSYGGGSSFKGYASGLTGTSWSTTPGGSSSPPATVDSYIGVLVSNQITKSGSSIAGNVTEVVVLKVDPGYGPDPSQPGNGRMVATAS